MTVPTHPDPAPIDLPQARARAGAAVNAVTCPPWCLRGHEHDDPVDPLHLGEEKTVPCAVTKRDAGHICGRTRCSVPEYQEPSCEDPVFASIVADNTGTAIEIGHGDDILPRLSPADAAKLGIWLIHLACEAAPEAWKAAS